jgi:uncharacterized protein (TIGR03435 family)
MLRTLLSDRFKLVTHIEMREQPVYVLMLARPDGRLGPQLKRATLPCALADRSDTAVRTIGQLRVDTSVNDRLSTILATGEPMDRIAARSPTTRSTGPSSTGPVSGGAFDAELRFTRKAQLSPPQVGLRKRRRSSRPSRNSLD